MKGCDAMNPGKVITVVTARASAAEQRKLLEGAISEAFSVNADIVVLSNIYNASEYNSYITNENSIYQLIESDRHDGIIFTDDSFMNPELRRKVTDIIDLSGKPVICTGSGDSRYESVNNNTGEDIRRIADHLIEVHGFTDIDLLTGPADSTESLRRAEGYRSSLEAHGISFSEDKVIYGDFWFFSGEKTALDYAEKRRKLPQAVLCANDYMAYALCDTLVSRGIRIPDDVAVMGYEHTGDRTDHYPLLSTFSRNWEGLGKKAVWMLYSRICGLPSECSTDTAGSLVPGDSCGCGADCGQISTEIGERKKQIYYTSLNDTGMLEMFLTESVTVSDLINALRRHSYFIPDISGLYLCLYDEWCVTPGNTAESRSGTADTVCYTITDIYREMADPVHFSRKSIFPDELRNSGHPNAFYCCPVFFLDEDFGYMIVRYDRAGCFGESFRSWLRIAANALEFLRMKNDISYLIECQNLSDYRDTETGLNNRKGLLNEIEIAARNRNQQLYSVCVVSFGKVTDSYLSAQEKISFEKKLLKDTAEILSGIAYSRGGFCGRTDDGTFVTAELAENAEETAKELKEAVSVHLYGLFRRLKIYGEDIVTVAAGSGNTEKCSVSEKITYLTETCELNNSSVKYPEKYAGYINFRRNIYLNPEKNADAEEAGRKLCVSSGYFRAVYKKIFSVSFHQDCIRLKTLLAKHYLVSTGMNIAAVSEKCGFENDKYFMQQFRSVTGYTPNQYRTKFMCKAFNINSII